MRAGWGLPAGGPLEYVHPNGASAGRIPAAGQREGDLRETSIGDALPTMNAAPPAYPPLSHDAFISYSRKDLPFAAAIETRLEQFAPPPGLNLPPRHLDIFRDTSDFAAGDYERNLDRHLSASRKLLVLCSPQARNSVYVNDEVERFIRLRGREHVIPVLLSGVPNDEATPERESEKAFPEALQREVQVPLAADFRNFDLARDKLDAGAYSSDWYKILAALYEVERGQIERRDEKRRQLARRRWLYATAVVMLSLSAVVIWALLERRSSMDIAQIDVSRLLAIRAKESPSIGEALLLATVARALAPTKEAVDSWFRALWQVQWRPVLLWQHQKPVTSLAISPDGKTLASADEEAAVLLWDREARQFRRTLRLAHKRRVMSVAFSPDGSTVASADVDGTILLTQVATGDPLDRLQKNQWPVASLAYSPDGSPH
jgi:WD40 repeat protein